VQLDAGEWEGASKRWRELVQGGRFVYEGIYYLAQIAERRGEKSDAIELYSRVTNTDLAVAAQSRAALLRARAGTLEDGLSALRAFGNENSEFAIEMLVAQASLLTEFGQGKQGVKVLDEAIADYPDRDDLLASKALLLEREKRTSEALKTMRELSRVRPDDPTALNMLGYTLVDRTRDIDEGLGMIRRALMAMPDNGAILDSMGWALHKLRRNEEALGYLQRAHERAQDPDIALHLGEVQWTLGRAEDARETWSKALERAPDDQELKDRLEKRKAK
jgi:tetratricopeptide (TPR) repeat protein